MPQPFRAWHWVWFVVLLLSSTKGWSLPPCPADGHASTWTDCVGTLTYANGNKYVGEWKGGKRNGQGTFTHWDGRVQEGRWENGKLLPANKPTPTVTEQKSPKGDFQKGLDAARHRDFATALVEWKPLAEQGHARAQYFLGLMYQRGNYVPRDIMIAVKWYLKSAEQGYTRAQYHLGRMYLEGKGVPKSYTTASNWFNRAAEQGHADAQNLLADLQKKISPQDPPATSAGNLQKGADAFERGNIAFRRGDYVTALREWETSAEQGNVLAQLNMGRVLALGKGVPKDYQTALKWFTLAAEQGHADAQIILGSMYEQGKGVPKNFKTAYIWLTLAASQKVEEARDYRDFVEKKMSRKQLKKGKKLLLECIKKKDKGCQFFNGSPGKYLFTSCKRYFGISKGTGTQENPLVVPYEIEDPPGKNIIIVKGFVDCISPGYVDYRYGGQSLEKGRDGGVFDVLQVEFTDFDGDKEVKKSRAWWFDITKAWNRGYE